MIPSLIQAQLQDYYDLKLNHRVDDFLISDRYLADSLEGRPNPRNTDEKILVLEESDGLCISLFLAEELLESLDENNPFDQLNSSNLNAYCTVLEGVSHFIYLCFNASHDRPVSRLEIELQAEVDKFVSIILLARKQGLRISWNDLSDVLFTHCRFDPELSRDELQRYRAANNYASAYCARLTLRSSGQISNGSTRTELCRFYRKRHRDKFSRCFQSSEFLPP
jgi:hypothetical protein